MLSATAGLGFLSVDKAMRRAAEFAEGRALPRIKSMSGPALIEISSSALLGPDNGTVFNEGGVSFSEREEFISNVASSAEKELTDVMTLSEAIDYINRTGRVNVSAMYLVPAAYAVNMDVAGGMHWAKTNIEPAIRPSTYQMYLDSLFRGT